MPLFKFLYKYYKARKNVRNLNVKTDKSQNLLENLAKKREKFKNC